VLSIETSRFFQAQTLRRTFNPPLTRAAAADPSKSFSRNSNRACNCPTFWGETLNNRKMSG
jgi:hypothetical protein